MSDGKKARDNIIPQNLKMYIVFKHLKCISLGMATFPRWVWYCKTMMAAKGSLLSVVPWILLWTSHVAKRLGMYVLNINVNAVIEREVCDSERRET